MLSERFWKRASIVTEWKFNVKSAIEDDCTKVFHQFVRLPKREGEEYLSSILEGPASDDLEFPTKSERGVKGYAACSYSTGDR